MWPFPNPFDLFGDAVGGVVGWAWDKVIQGIYTWFANGLLLLMEWVWDVLDTATTPRVTDAWFTTGLVRPLAAIAVAVIVALTLASAIQAGFTGRPELIVDAFKEGPKAIVARFTPGERSVLRSYPPDLDLNFVQNRFSGGDDTFDLLEVRAADELAESAPLPDRIADDELPDPDDAVTTRQFELNGSSRINGEPMDPTRVDTVVAVDSTEIWEVTNGSGNPHNFHVHDVQFRIVDYNGEPPPPRLAGPKDTVFLPLGRSALHRCRRPGE